MSSGVRLPTFKFYLWYVFPIWPKVTYLYFSWPQLSHPKMGMILVPYLEDFY